LKHQQKKEVDTVENWTECATIISGKIMFRRMSYDQFMEKVV